MFLVMKWSSLVKSAAKFGPKDFIEMAVGGDSRNYFLSKYTQSFETLSISQQQRNF
jgi:hypothetical protein